MIRRRLRGSASLALARLVTLLLVMTPDGGIVSACSRAPHEGRLTAIGSAVQAGDVMSAIAPLDGRGGGILTFNSDRDGNSEVYVMNADGSGQRNITNDAASDGFGVWSPDGARVAFVSDRDGQFGVFVMSVSSLSDAQFGRPLKVAGKRPSSRVSWSKDGSKIMFDAWPECDIFVVDAAGGDLTQLTDTPDCETQPQYSPDGASIAFAAERNGRQDIYTMRADGTNRVQLTRDGVSYFPSWSPDGSTIAFGSTRPGRQDVDICLIGSDGANRRWLTDFPELDEFPSWSPDGRRIAYQSSRGGARVFVMSVDGSDGHQISGDGAHNDGEPNWRPVRVDP